jgi:hypothetical protein
MWSTSKNRRFRVLAGVSVVAAICTISGAAQPAAAAAAGKVARAGTIDCTAVTGKLTFSPPMRLHLSVPESMHISLRLASKDCVRSESAAHMGRQSISSTTLGGPNQCTELFTGGTHVPTVWRTRWASRSTMASLSSFTAILGLTTSASKQEWEVPGTSGTASGSGSYVGSDSGTSTTFTFASNKTQAQMLAACSSRRGLSSIKIVSGSAYFG